MYQYLHYANFCLVCSATDNVLEIVKQDDEVCLASDEPEKPERKSRGTTGKLGCDLCDY